MSALAAVQQQLAVPSSDDVRQLLSCLDLSRVSATADPVCSNALLQTQLRQQGLQHLLQQPPLPAAVYIMAVQPEVAVAAVAAAVARQPAFIACFLPTQELPSALLEQLQHQRPFFVLRAEGGIWVCLAPGVLPVHQWLRH